MIQGLENLETKHKVKLTIPLVASYLARGVKRTKIADMSNISVDHIQTRRTDRERRRAELQQELKKLTGRSDYGVEMGDKPEIIDVDGEHTP